MRVLGIGRFRRGRVAWKAGFIAAVAIFCSLLGPAEVAVAAPTLTLSPTQGGVGTTVQVTGTGWASSTQTEIWFDSKRVATTTSSSAGRLNTTFRVPAVATTGIKPVHATQGRVWAPASGGGFRVTTVTAPPAAPQSARALPYGPFNIRVGWVDYSNNETGFEITNGTTTRTAPASAGTGSVVWFQWAVPSPNTRVCFRVRAVNSAGKSAWTPGSVCATSDSSGRPAAPSGVTARANGPNAIAITFNDNATNETAFQFYNGVTTRTVTAQLPDRPQGVYWSWTGLAPRTYMCFKVRSYNDYGPSAWAPGGSAWACATTTG